MPMQISETLLEILVCPQDKGSLFYLPEKGFYNPRLKICYPIIDDIPVLLAQEAREISGNEVQEYIAEGMPTGPNP